MVQRETIVCLSVFDVVGNLPNNKLVASGVEPKVILATNINRKLVGENVTALWDLPKLPQNMVEFRSYCLVPSKALSV